MGHIRRITRGDHFNMAINPILYHVAPELVSVDLSDIVAAKCNLALAYRDAYALFVYLGDGQYAGHYLFPPEVRGAIAKRVAKKLLAEVFTTYGASAIRGQTPRVNRAARVLNRSLGFTPVGASRDLFDRDCVDYLLERATWESLQSLASDVAKKPLI